MDNVIYSATPLQTFMMSFAMIALMFVLGAAGLGSAAFNKKQPAIARLALAGSGGLLIAVGLGLILVTARSMSNGSRTVAVQLDDKFIARDNCGDGGVCERHVLEMQAGGKYYDVQVDAGAYEQAQVNGCYQLTYYPGGGLLGESEYAATYESISSVTRIEAVDPAFCQ